MLEEIGEIGKAAIKSGELKEKRTDMNSYISPNWEDVIVHKPR